MDESDIEIFNVISYLPNVWISLLLNVMAIYLNAWAVYVQGDECLTKEIRYRNVRFHLLL